MESIRNLQQVGLDIVAVAWEVPEAIWEFNLI